MTVGSTNVGLAGFRAAFSSVDAFRPEFRSGSLGTSLLAPLMIAMYFPGMNIKKYQSALKLCQ
jgi:hypothetical protein